MLVYSISDITLHFGSPLDEGLLESKISELPAELANYVRLKKNPISRAERALGMMQLVYLAKRYANIDVEKIDLNKSGKPIIPYRGYDFNISHSNGLCTCIFGDEKVGIDLQAHNKKIDAIKLAARFFTPSEFRYIEHAHDINNAFFETWAKKEAIAKYLGNGLAAVLNGTDVFESPKKYGVKLFTKQFNFKETDFHLVICASGSPEEKLFDA